jgi:hypothetical protein
MLKIVINNNKDNSKCYQVTGIYRINGKEIKSVFYVYAEDEKDATEKINFYKSAQPVKINLQTLADAQNAYKKEFGVEVEIDSDEFIAYTKNRV